MKKAILAAIAACLTGLMLLACGGAHAQTVQESFTCANGHVVNTDTLRSFAQGSGEVILVSESGGVSYPGMCTDPSGAVYTKMATDTTVLQNYIKLPTTPRLLNSREMLEVFCNVNGNHTQITWKIGNVEVFSDTNCSTLTSVIQPKAK